jgi:hypothetical protein
VAFERFQGVRAGRSGVSELQLHRARWYQDLRHMRPAGADLTPTWWMTPDENAGDAQ